MNKEFQYTQIEGMLSLEEATAELVNVAKCIQRTHTYESAKIDRLTNDHIFHMRCISINSLLNLIKDYIDQAPWPERPVRVKFGMSHDTWDKVVNHSHFPKDSVNPPPKLSVETEGNEYFVVEYETLDEFNKALIGFDGMLKYEVLP